jgi:hypothetical protein
MEGLLETQSLTGIKDPIILKFFNKYDIFQCIPVTVIIASITSQRGLLQPLDRK